MMAVATVTVKLTPYDLQVINAALKTYAHIWQGIERDKYGLGDLPFVLETPSPAVDLVPSTFRRDTSELIKQVGLK